MKWLVFFFFCRFSVATGTYGVLTLRDRNHAEREIYLHATNGKNYLPVPKLFWKVVYSISDHFGVAIVTVNDPYTENVTNYVLCEDVCDKIKWFKMDTANTKRGYTYCCEMKQFLKATGFTIMF